jgi:ribonuclease P/MRP protein subunit POP1
MSRFLTGARVLDTHIYKPGSYPFDLIAPINIIWKPPQLVNDIEPTGKQSTSTKTPASTKEKQAKRKRGGKGKEKADVRQTSAVPADLSDTDGRTVWIRSHPVVFDEVFSALQMSASMTLEAFKRSPGATQLLSTEVEIADLREHINVFEIMGPKSNQVLKGALTPVGEDKREEFKKVSK